MMSMEELSRLSRNIGEDKELREAALRELAKRENNRLGIRVFKYINALTPANYGAHYLS